VSRLSALLNDRILDSLEKREQLRIAITRVSTAYGGDSREFFEHYINEVFNTWGKRPGEALACFNDIFLTHNNGESKNERY